MAKLILTDPKGKSHEFPLLEADYVIGKRPECNLMLTLSGISRKHCAIRQKNGSFFLRDLGSRNGTFLNEEKIGSEDVKLSDKDIIKISKVSIQFLASEKIINPSEILKKKKSDAASPAGAGQDSDKVIELRRRIHKRLLEELDLKKLSNNTSDEEMRFKTEETIYNILPEIETEIPPSVNPKDLVNDVLDEALGLGPLEGFIADPELTEIMVNNWDEIYIEKNGKLIRTEKKFSGNQQVLQVIRRILAPIGRRIDETTPLVDARLKDGSRVNAIIPPLALKGPSITIRKFSQTPFEVEDLIRFGSITKAMADFLKVAVEERANILISGGTGSGKTSLLNVVSSFISPSERIVTIEDAAELKLYQPHVVSLEAKPPNIEGKGAIPIRKLVINSLRMRPDRIIVGECRGGEALDMLQAMNTGHDGSLTTVHANSTRDSLARLETLVLMAGLDLPSKAIREQVNAAMDVVVQTARLKDGSRKITEIVEVTGLEGDVFQLQPIFKFIQKGYKDEKIVGHFEATGNVPKLYFELKERGIDVDLSIFSKGQA